jgi:hypothetical protein
MNITRSTPGWASAPLAGNGRLNIGLDRIFLVCYNTGGLNWTSTAAGAFTPNRAIVPLGMRYQTGDDVNLFTSYTSSSDTFYTDVVFEPYTTPVLTIYKALSVTSAMPSLLVDWTYVDIDFDKNNPPASTATPNTIVARDGLGGINTSGVIYTNSQVKNKVVLLFGDASNQDATDFYGFGINSATLRYNVPSGATHRFYVNTTDVVDINSSGLYLPTIGGTKSALNYYEEYTYTTSFIGPTTYNNIQFQIVRVGKLVTMTQRSTFEPQNCTVPSNSSFNSSTYIPARFRPNSGQLDFAIKVRNGSTLAEVGDLIINNDFTQLTISRAYPSSWANGVTSTWLPFSVSWIVA